jgi:hypothetical protein
MSICLLFLFFWFETMLETSITMTKRPMRPKKAQDKTPGDWDFQQGVNKVNKRGALIQVKVPPLNSESGEPRRRLE